MAPRAHPPHPPERVPREAPIAERTPFASVRRRIGLYARALWGRAPEMVPVAPEGGSGAPGRVAIVGDTDPLFHRFFFACQYAGLVPVASEAGARVVILNAEPTPFDDMADAVLNGSIGETLPQLTTT